MAYFSTFFKRWKKICSLFNWGQSSSSLECFIQKSNTRIPGVIYCCVARGNPEGCDGGVDDRWLTLEQVFIGLKFISAFSDIIAGSNESFGPIGRGFFFQACSDIFCPAMLDCIYLWVWKPVSRSHVCMWTCTIVGNMWTFTRRTRLNGLCYATSTLWWNTARCYRYMCVCVLIFTTYWVMESSF